MSQLNQTVRRDLGFTLIELMITVVIVSILLAIAVPNYSESVRKSTRSVARTHLLDIANRQQEFFYNNKTFANDLTGLGYAAATIGIGKDGEIGAAGAGDAAYNLSVTAADAISYSLSAVPVNAQAKDTPCGTFILASTGAKSASGALGADCWN